MSSINDFTNKGKEYPPPDTEWDGNPCPFGEIDCSKNRSRGQGIRITTPYSRMNN